MKTEQMELEKEDLVLQTKSFFAFFSHLCYNMQSNEGVVCMRNKKIRILFSAFSLAQLLGGFQLAKADSMSDAIYQYKVFMNSPAKEYLEEYLTEDENHEFEGISQDGITLEEVNFRKGPSIYYDVIRMLDREEHVEVLGVCDNDWYLVRSRDTIGFVYGEYLRVISPEFKESQKLDYRPTFLCAVEAVSGANVRKSPDVKTGIILGGLNTGDRLPAYERLENGWYHVDFHGEDAYIYGELVKEIYATSVENYPMIYVMNDAPFRSEPYGDAISSVSANQILYLLGENQDYFFTQVNGNFGYIGKSHCERLTDTYVVVDISDQILKIYHRGEEIFSTYVVTGKDSTPTYEGAFYIRSKERNVILRGIDYATPVEWWMPFDGGRGLHDASWREYFGGDIYHWGGTHGCVNMPAEVTPYVYNILHVGDRVFVKK